MRFAPLAIGAVLMVMVYAGGHVSGGHYNPAVSLAVLVRRKLTAREAAFYILTQLVAGLAAALVVRALGEPRTAVAVSNGTRVFVAEALFTFALAYVVLNVATASETRDNSYFGLAIGFTVVVGAYAVGWISGGAFNPAVAEGTSLIGILNWDHIWLYIAAEALAAVAFLALHGGAVSLFSVPDTGALVSSALVEPDSPVASTRSASDS